ncbi:hypothetical protein HAX54_034904, partial [Datura stramonium]|nr:hypothetical protein [Datura stramonium]
SIGHRKARRAMACSTPIGAVHRGVLGGQDSNPNSTRYRSCKIQVKSKEEQ